MTLFFYMYISWFIWFMLVSTIKTINLSKNLTKTRLYPRLIFHYYGDWLRVYFPRRRIESPLPGAGELAFPLRLETRPESKSQQTVEMVGATILVHGELFQSHLNQRNFVLCEGRGFTNFVLVRRVLDHVGLFKVCHKLHQLLNS